MRQNYNSFEYWESLIIKNKTIRGHMLMDKTPTDKSLYIHTLIFSKGNGLNNVWSYFPNVNALIGYIQYSFLQEAFYIWINGKKGTVSYIPVKPVEEIINEGERSKKITKLEAENMRKHVKMIKHCWELPKNKVSQELKRFVRDFNRTWYGDSREFLYLKIFDTAEELGNFVIESNYMTTSEEEFKNKTSEDISTWNEICIKATTDKECGEKFRNILQKNLTEVI
ncbi:hypothetical protein [Clostridium celatum]|uniref:hypothetical protein n=1 Tax=Clostridium celatum TaxID=36834 RepID=UPI000591418E|nr:hypothetical protein [Clostridium celatum]MCE9654904.1 hypothetical protein [Clostridium celatum]MDY3360313.1 hypothetical protein [Clostridium celatum]